MKEIKLDEQKLQEMAQQYAMQGAEKAIRDFYTGYDSPFMKEVQRELKEKMETNLFFELSQMTAAINKAMNDKVSEMANTVVANTFLPMLNRMFSQEKKTVVTTQDLYEHFGDAMKEDLGDDFDPERMEIEIKKHDGMISDFQDLSFRYDCDTKFELSLMSNGDPKTDEHGNTLYQQYVDYIKKPLPKVVFYIIMQEQFPEYFGKDDREGQRGDLGYKLKLNI